jgi:predicted DNA-binding transcriptional regulator AlpA
MRRDLEHALKLARDLNVEQLPEFLGELEQVRVTALARLAAPVFMQPQMDRQLEVDEAAKLLGMSEDYLYRHHQGFPFTRREGRRLLFSLLGIQKYIREK